MNMEQFLSSKTGQRLVKIAEKEQNDFNNAILGLQEKLATDKQDLHHLQFGLAQNKEKVIFLDGNPVLATTNVTSHVERIEPITAENFDKVSPQDWQNIRNQSAVTYQRLKAGTFKPNESDRYYTLLDLAENGEDFSVLEALANAPQSDNLNAPNYNADAWNYYDSVADRHQGIPKLARHFKNARSQENIMKASIEVQALENQIENSIASNDIVALEIPSTSVQAEGQSE
ncbi:hypothetical protein [Bacillus cereus group sp. MG6]|uniref:hypothetical protein n=1 Tax=Bacillus cereus group sp. MG6 TaxID=3040246 RepID=UPI003391AB6D